jgi:hypothetical protein
MKLQKSHPISLSFTSQRNDMFACFILLERQPFYFSSYPDGRNKLVRKVELCAYLLSYKLHAPQKESDYFLVIGANVDKVFPESYKPDAPTYNEAFPKRICTAFDLVYLQEALRQRPENGLFYPLRDKMIDHRSWIDKLVKDITGRKNGNIRGSVPLEYATIDVRSAELPISICPDENTLTRNFNESFYSDHTTDFNHLWKDSDTLLALCLLKGNGNMANVSDRQVEKYQSHKFTNNRNEMTYVGKNGIVFLRTRHPFEIHSEEERESIDKSLPKDLEDVQNVYEICSALCAKKQIEQLSRQLKEKPEEHIRQLLGDIAQFLNMKLTHVIDLDNKYKFIYEQMGILDEFKSLKEIGELQADSYQIYLSRKINFIITIFTISAFIVAALQIIQNHLNTHHVNMEIKTDIYSQLLQKIKCLGLHFCGDIVVVLILFMLIVAIALAVIYYAKAFPLKDKNHKYNNKDR